ncbi:O-antigen ligase family protein [Spiribacter pallidus]|uniref:O-antigen ligase family protein n=1 Tax=Spiribacter pallidus TaxID=1987936 RepID=UPI0034A098AA
MSQGRNLLSLRWEDLGAFLFFSAAFVIPSGYSVGAVILLLGSLATLRIPDIKKVDARVWLLVGAFALYALFWSIDGLVRGEGIRELDRPVRFLLAAFVLIRLYNSPPSEVSVLLGISLGALAAGSLAVYEYYWVGVSRVNGFMPVNSFGMLAALYAGFCLSMVQVLRFEKAYYWVSLISIAGGLLAGGAALLSGSRGAFLTLAGLGVWLLAKELVRCGRWQIRLLIVVATLVAGIVVYTASGTSIKQRVDTAVVAATAYVVDGERIGVALPARIDMWHGGLILFLEKPFTGWGESGYQLPLANLVDRGVIADDHASGRHLHNQVIHVLATKGIVGVAILTILLAVPFWLVLRQTAVIPDKALQGCDKLDQSLTGELILIMLGAYILGGMTRVPLEHHSGVMIFSFGLILLITARPPRTAAGAA